LVNGQLEDDVQGGIGALRVLEGAETVVGMVGVFISSLLGAVRDVST